jgi:hypothetical protein
MRAMKQAMRMFGAAAFVAVALAGCDATETNPVMEDDGPPNPATSREEGLRPTVAPPSGVEIADDNGSAASERWTQPEDPKQTRFLGLVADKPVTWIEHPGAGQMEATRFTVPGRDGTPAAEIVVFQGIGGTLEANIERWRGQFRANEDGTLIEPEIDTITAGDDMEITLVEFLGDWQGMHAPSHTSDQQMIMAVVDSPSGLLFIRFVGNQSTVGPNRNAFIDMMRSLRVAE